jgi:hypothetical protein
MPCYTGNSNHSALNALGFGAFSKEAASPARDRILEYPNALNALEQLVAMGADRETVLLSLEMIACKCERENVEHGENLARNKQFRSVRAALELDKLLRKVAKKVERSNSICAVRTLGLLRATPNPKEELYLCLPRLIRDYADFVAGRKGHHGHPPAARIGRNVRPSTPPKVFLVEHVRRRAGKSCLNLLTGLVEAAYWASGVKGETSYGEKALEQAWKRYPQFRSSLSLSEPRLLEDSSKA